MRKISHRKQKAEPVCTGLPDDSEKESPVWVFIDREQKRGVSFPCGEGIPPDQLPSRLGDCLRNRPRADQSADWSGLDWNCPAELR